MTMWPEWAWAVGFLGKDTENRTWAFPKKLIGQDVAIHAGKLIGGQAGPTAKYKGFEALCEMAQLAGWEATMLPAWEHRYMRNCAVSFAQPGHERAEVWDYSLPRGVVVAVVTVTGCVVPSEQYRVCGSPWADSGQFWWLLANVRRLERPVECKGDRRLWRLPEDVERAVRAQL